MPRSEYNGLLFIGDPHLASRAVGFRKDSYGKSILEKLRWCLAYADREKLLPVFLGDLFHHPRDNANWLMGEVLELFSRHEVLGIYGNHDCREDELGEDDSLDVLISSGHFRLLDSNFTWRGTVHNLQVAIFGVPWGRKIPKEFERDPSDQLCILVTHHDIRFSGRGEDGRFKPFSILGIDFVVNGHIHRQLDEQEQEGTTWLNPGNISRIVRSDALRTFIPTVLTVARIDDAWQWSRVPVPHQPFDEVFYEAVVDSDADVAQSEFVRGLAELQARRTESGAGLRVFLAANLYQFDEAVQREITNLANEVLSEEELVTGEIA